MLGVGDFQVGRDGNGLHAAAAAGVSWVIGHADGPPLSLPVNLPEKWCGLMGANMALAVLLEKDLQGEAMPRRVDIAAADVLRAYADQNAGNHLEIDAGWRRNGSVAVEHGGIFPQGYFPCADGHVGLVGRSKRDWVAIREVIGMPDWAKEDRFENPFELAAAPDEVETLLAAALMGFDRDTLLAQAIKHGAPMAPVYSSDELKGRDVVRKNFFDEEGAPQLPFDIVTRKAS